MTTSKRIVLTTFGSYGDLHPYIAVGLALEELGHHPVLATSDVYREKVQAAGLEFHAVRPDLPPLDDPKAAEMIARVMDTSPGAGVEFLIRDVLLSDLRGSYEDLSAAVAGADFMVSHPITLAGPLVAEKTGIKWYSSVLAPVSFFSRYDPPVPPTAQWVFNLARKVGPLATGFLIELIKRRTAPWIKPLAQLRRELGLGPGAHPIFEGQHSPYGVLALFSRFMAEPQTDWPPHTRITGIPFYDKKDGAPITPELKDFLDAGPAPIVFTLGSSAVFTAGEFYRESLAAACALGSRAVFLIGDARNAFPEALPEGMIAVDYAPYGDVLPRAAVVVHQGGVGTTGQALRAEVPQLIMPFNHDQPDNAERVRKLGAGRVIARKHYHAARVIRELEELLTGTDYASNAHRVGAAVRAENGAVEAAKAIIAGTET
ncbi:MAG: nucleotide disphospho-sugar-binding domain-containing protein [Pyrinomonadaceae bacterium]